MSHAAVVKLLTKFPISLSLISGTSPKQKPTVAKYQNLLYFCYNLNLKNDELIVNLIHTSFLQWCKSLPYLVIMLFCMHMQYFKEYLNLSKHSV